ncbi:hypothetical protein WM40_08665 [Robbsia andropogonis]|uniref:AmpD protein n=1 Tax=Robbsia andropogonis TaxID=28092 RepID=A0A0F5K3I7_9BURK|nr:DUF1841 family protein [Robbsia andropogonis]KKB64082.1 hypothetical protein WM40_08665 [Robbsia andropogonis]MCP1120582.1 DUF1841 family protein [Robbsia andropogonis]MCP1128755.1 DUF1841 family protein [Robbsia andropogonis]
MFDPSRDDVRRFFCETWRKRRAGEILTPMEAIAADWILDHPETHPALEDPEAVSRDYTPENGAANPFLHLSLHLAVSEQLSIDQPPGIRAAYNALTSRLDDPHAAQHEIIDCLGETIWEAQRNRTEMDAAAYLQRIHRRASRH